MSSPAIALPGRSSLLWISRARGLFTGVGSALTLTLILIAARTLLACFYDSGSLVDLNAFRKALTRLPEFAWAALPGALIIVVGVNLAPPTGARRWIWLAYGDAAILSLAHAEPRGVVATISIPLR